MKPSITSANIRAKPRAKALPILKIVLAAAAWLVLWQLCAVRLARPLLLPSPFSVLRRLLELGQEGLFWRSVALSLGKVLLAFGLATLCGSLLAIPAAAWPWFYSFLRPPMALMRATPVASFTLLALVWISSAQLPIFIASLMVLPMVYENVYKGIQSADRQLLEWARAYGLSPLQRLRFVYLPAVLPYVISACINGLGFAWKAGIAAEVLGLPRVAIGRQIHDAKIYVEIPDLFAWTLVVVLLSMVLEQLLLLLMKKLQRQVLLAQEVQ